MDDNLDFNEEIVIKEELLEEETELINHELTEDLTSQNLNDLQSNEGLQSQNEYYSQELRFNFIFQEANSQELSENSNLNVRLKVHELSENSVLQQLIPDSQELNVNSNYFDYINRETDQKTTFHSTFSGSQISTQNLNLLNNFEDKMQKKLNTQKEKSSSIHKKQVDDKRPTPIQKKAKKRSFKLDKKDDTNSFKCQECSYVGKTNIHLRRHLLVHSEGRFKCSECSYVGKTNIHLRRHLLVHSEGRFKCSECNFQTHFLSYFKDHSLIHSPVRSFKCSFCDFASKTKSNIKKHERIHLKTIFRCSLCKYTSSHERNLKQHQTKHAKNKILKQELITSECPVIEKEQNSSNSVNLVQEIANRGLENILSKNLPRNIYVNHDILNSFSKRPLIILRKLKICKCDYCNFVASTQLQINQHKLSHFTTIDHSYCTLDKKISQSGLNKNGNNMIKGLSVKQEFESDTTSKKFNINDLSDNGLIQCKEFICNICNYTATSDKSWKRHKSSHALISDSSFSLLKCIKQEVDNSICWETDQMNNKNSVEFNDNMELEIPEETENQSPLNFVGQKEEIAGSCDSVDHGVTNESLGRNNLGEVSKAPDSNLQFISPAIRYFKRDYQTKSKGMFEDHLHGSFKINEHTVNNKVIKDSNEQDKVLTSSNHRRNEGLDRRRFDDIDFSTLQKSGVLYQLQ